jgi:hypothetical protein
MRAVSVGIERKFGGQRDQDVSGLEYIQIKTILISELESVLKSAARL